MVEERVVQMADYLEQRKVGQKVEKMEETWEVKRAELSVE